MKKYVFENPEIEKALRLVANDLGISDEVFDKQVQEQGHLDVISLGPRTTNLFSLSFPDVLLKEVEVFDPDNWNEHYIVPPEAEYGKGTSKIMLIENDDNFPYKGYFDFELNCWRELGTYQEAECLRYRSYPTD